MILNNIISAVITHKAAIMLGAASVGVIATAIAATKDRDKYVDNVYDEFDKIETETFTDEEVEEIAVNGILDVNLTTKYYKKYVERKRRALVFLKSYWRTGLIIFLTVALMLLSHISMAKELAATAAALGVMTTKYSELKDTLKEKYPETYEKVQQLINERNVRGKLTDEAVNSCKDDHELYYDNWSSQLFSATMAEVKEAECAINEQMMNTGEASLFDYLATFPSSSGIKLGSWMKHIGWYEGDTTYSYNAGFMGGYLKPHIVKESIIFKGEKMEVNSIYWTNNPDFEPDLSDSEYHKLDDILARRSKAAKRKKVKTA